MAEPQFYLFVRGSFGLTLATVATEPLAGTPTQLRGEIDEGRSRAKGRFRSFSLSPTKADSTTKMGASHR